MKAAPQLRFLFLAAAGLFAASLYAEEPLRIGTISIERDDVFSAEESSRGWPYRLVNGFHKTTRENTVRRFLLFEEGDVYDPELLENTERNLRSLGIFKSASVTAGPPHDGVVDVTVATHDAFTLQIGLSAGQVGGRFVGGVRLGESNLLGSGRALSVSYGQDTQRTFRSIEFRDPALLTSYGMGHLLYANNSDGRAMVVEYQRPFYSVVTPWSGGVSGADVVEHDFIYESAEAVSTYERELREFTGSYAIAAWRMPRAAVRLGLGLDWRDEWFRPLPGHEGEVRPDNRMFHYVIAQAELFTDDYVKLDYVNRDLRVEDFSLGRHLALRFGVSPAAFSVPRTTEMASLQWDEGWRLGTKSILQATLSFTSRLDQGRAENAILDLRLLLIRRFDTSLPQALVSRLEVTRGWNLDLDTQFFADGASGLRAYRLYAFEGDRRIIWNVEHRVYSGHELFQVVSPGAAVFFDAAAIAPKGSPMSIKMDAGIGLRFAVTRASSVPILRVDVGYAFQPDPKGRRGWLVSFSGSQAF
jgi:hemolysin activation/secretion protein